MKTGQTELQNKIARTHYGGLPSYPTRGRVLRRSVGVLRKRGCFRTKRRGCRPKMRDGREIEKLRALSDTGDKRIRSVPTGEFDTKPEAGKALSLSTERAHECCEAIHTLCTCGQVNMVTGFLRSAFECLVQAKYMYCDQESHVWILNLRSYEEKEKSLKKYKEFY